MIPVSPWVGSEVGRDKRNPAIPEERGLQHAEAEFLLFAVGAEQEATNDRQAYFRTGIGAGHEHGKEAEQASTRARRLGRGIGVQTSGHCEESKTSLEELRFIGDCAKEFCDAMTLKHASPKQLLSVRFVEADFKRAQGSVGSCGSGVCEQSDASTVQILDFVQDAVRIEP